MMRGHTGSSSRTASTRWHPSWNAVITHTNKAKQTNLTKNPLLVAMMELNAQALSYWRDLGLTPSGYKKLNADVVKDPGEGKFEELLSKLV